MDKHKPNYIHLLESGELRKRAEMAYDGLRRCTGCAWNCGVDRTAGTSGKCRTGLLARVASYGPHLGEEDPLRGWRGSGTIFFSNCNLACVYCQNDDISQSPAGIDVDVEQLAAIMMELQAQGCHNINLVSPSHVVPQIIASALVAAAAGLRLPFVYNTGGYDSLASLALLEGIVDIYMPDMKYADEKIARQYSGIPHYPQTNQAAVREMHRQVGDLQLDEHGLAVSGLLVRHLILPGELAGTRQVARFLAEEISPNTYVNLMDQYHPAYQASQYPELNRRISPQEYRQAVQAARDAGLTRLDQRRSAF